MSNLRNAGLDIFSFFEVTPDLVCIAGKDGYFRNVNAAVIQKLGYTEQELLARPISALIYPPDRKRTQSTRAELISGKALVNFENRYVTKSGELVWLAWTSIYIPENEIVFAIAKDISQKKNLEQEVAEKYIKFKSLASHFKSSMEADRKDLAAELHDELAQLAAVIKMDLQDISQYSQHLPQTVMPRFDHALAVTDLLLKTITRISFSISPGMLDDLGLSATISWYCREFSLLNNIPCTVNLAFNEADLSKEVQLDFFRICQEALTNVMYHAQASSVQVRIEEHGHQVSLLIADNGRGFDLKNLVESSGMEGMRKRAASINGPLSIQSSPGTGTTVCITVEKAS